MQSLLLQSVANLDAEPLMLPLFHVLLPEAPAVLAEPLIGRIAFTPELVSLDSHSWATVPVIGQYFDQDVVGSVGDALHTFVESGQVWALLAGAVVGYLVRSLTAY